MGAFFILVYRRGVGDAQPPADPASPGPGGEDLDSWLEERERGALLAALAACNENQAQAARRLGIRERSLWHRLKKPDIKVEKTLQGNP